MIIPKAPHLTPEQLAEIERIVAEFQCRIQPIYGAHRTLYAIIGDERSELMVNRILHHDWIDRVDRMESVYKLMDIRSDLAHHEILIGSHVLGRSPMIMAGHCTIDPKNPQAFLETAQAVKEAGAQVLRRGVGKPRTTPYSYQGDNSAIDILVEARARTGLPVVTEVMDEEQLAIALEAKVEVLQIGTRNALNYSLLKHIGKATSGTSTVVLLKRGRHMGPIDEYISAGEYIVACGNANLVFCPRGTLPALDGYRNQPDESITPLLKRKSWAPVIVDPSHSVGKAPFVPASALAAIAYGADGVIVEAHVDPSSGIGDDPVQAITPDRLKDLIQDIQTVWSLKSRFR